MNTQTQMRGLGGARLTALCAILMTGAGASLRAQQANGGAKDGAVTGVVVDAGSGSPLGSAVIAIEAAGDVAVVQPAGSGVFLSRVLSVMTGPDGAYRFGGLAPGSYRLHVRHLGYREAVLDVELSRSTFQVSVGLVVNPIRLERIDVEVAGQAFGRTLPAVEEARVGRMAAEGLRQERFLESDARVLTQSDVTEAVTLGESDLLRALQRLPGVSARDDYSAGLWTRGASWGQTRAYYDGLPLFNPVHALGLLSSLNPDAVGLASFHPGVRSAAIGEGAAGVLSVTSRGAERPGIHGLSELSVTSARATVDVASRDGMRGLVLGVRRSYVDAATRLAQLAGGDSATYVPYAFLDLTARGDVRLGARTGIEASALWAQDNVSGGVRNLLRPTRGHWGNQLARTTLEHGLGKVRTRTSLGVTRFDGLINPPAPVQTSGLDGVPVTQGSGTVVPEHGSTRNGLTVLTAGTEVAQAAGPRRPSWAAGAQLVGYRQSYGGQFPRPYPVAVILDTLFLNETLLIPGVWGEHRWVAASHFALETGARVEFPNHARNAPVLAAAPRVTSRYTLLDGRATVSAGYARSWQYTQALAPAGPSVGPDLYVTDVWLLAGDTIPAIRADVATLGSEVSLGLGWVVSGTAYLRHSTGVAVPEPSPGVLSDRRPIFVAATNRARGLELGLRRVVGRITASLSYTQSRSTLTTGTFEFPSPADRRHIVDATAMYRATPGLRFGAALTAATGAPFSRFFLGAQCDGLGAETAQHAVGVKPGVLR